MYKEHFHNCDPFSTLFKVKCYFCCDVKKRFSVKIINLSCNHRMEKMSKLYDTN